MIFQAEAVLNRTAAGGQNAAYRPTSGKIKTAFLQLRCKNAVFI
jgi:hypothetical protein